MIRPQPQSLRSLAVIAAVLATSGQVHAALTAVFFDGYDVSAGSFEVNFEHNNGTRQGGVLAPINYAQSPSGSDYHHQVLGNPGPLLLAGDPGAGLVFGSVSPNYNFNSTMGAGIVGKKISFTLDVNANTQAYSDGAGIILGSAAGNIDFGAATPHLGFKFVEDGLFGGGNFVQLWNETGAISGAIPNPAGAAAFNVDIFINDTDLNPWDGIGATTFDLLINGTPVVSHTRPAGGFTNNFLTLQGRNGHTGAGFSLSTHLVDNLVVFAEPVPEPGSAVLLALGFAGALRRRRAVR